MNNKNAAALVVAASLCWGIIGIFTRSLHGSGISSIQITFWRSLITAIIMIAVCLIKDKNLLKLEKIKDIWLFIGTGVCSIVFFNACYFSAMQYLSLSAACVLLYTAPAMVVIMSRIFFKEAIIKRKIFALIVSFIGCIFMTGLLSDGPVTPKGILLGIGAGFGYSLYSIIGSVALKKYKPFTVTTYTFIIAAICLIPFGVKGGLPGTGSSKYII